MPTEMTAYPFAVTWRVNEADPCLVEWSRNNLRRKSGKLYFSWQDFDTYDTPEEARAVATANGRAQYIPAKGDASPAGGLTP